jgi:hypothetical protein
MAILNNSNAITTTGKYDVNNSLRFRGSASAYLNRTLTTPTNGRIWTLSVWLKRGSLSSTLRAIMTAQSGGSEDSFAFLTNDTIRLYFSAYSSAGLTTNAVFRDPSAWYHIVLAVDTTQATASNRVKLYVNGTQQTFTGSDYPSQNATPFFNTALPHYIGYYANNAPYIFDGYMAEVNFIDGSAKTPSDFGETDTTTGVWKPKAYTGTYGTNGFYLKFSDIATTSGSNAGLGKDFSGNTNYWTTNNISVTSGTTYDAMTDSPTNTSATVANYCTLNPVDTLNWLSQNGTITLSNSNLTFSSNNAGNMTEGTMAVSSGKWYFEITFASSNTFVGIRATRAIPTGDVTYRYYNNTGVINYTPYNSTTQTTVTTVASSTSGDVMGVAFDLDNNTISWYKNNTLLYTLTGVVADTYAPATGGASTATGSVNFGQRPFAYTPPTGFNRLNTFNLPTSTIVKGNTVMDATLYTGNNTGQTITNAGAFRPDFLWIKVRTNTYDHTLADSVRGVSAFLASNTTAAEGTNSELTSFNSNGFTLGATGSMARNVSGQNYVAWQWQAGQGTNTTNTAGSITSTVSVNANAGFSIVTYTGNGTNGATIGHGLGVAPRWVIVKRRNSSGDDWLHYHISLGATQSVAFDTNAAITSSTRWNNTAPSSTVVTLGTSTGVNANGGTYVAYCWSAIPGFSAFGSYTANASADGPFIYTGFRPRWILFKRSTSATNWYLIDTSVSPINASTAGLYPNTSAGESTEGAVDILSNGFKCRVSSGAFNFPSGETFIYMAFAENPFSSNNRAR